jgi:4-amino-4-deoxy-L-arabinose transferase-like glycosyltransferase
MLLSNPLALGNDDSDARKRCTQATVLWQRVVLSVIIALSIFLNFFRLGQNQYAGITASVNGYYAAAVKSMLMNWHNFFFAAFDPQGFLAIDKPPVGFWIQVISARIFGLNEWSLLFPEALAGVGAVGVLYILVRRIFGSNAGLIAALALALTPISVITSRNNTIDSVLILTLLFAAWALSIAVETGSLRWLLLSALLVGLGFNIKMLEAYLVLPPFILAYLLGAPQRLRLRILHLLLAGVVLLVVSASWITIVDLVPAAQRPYITSTPTDSELDLALGYNGLSRVLDIGNSTNGTGSHGEGTTSAVNTTALLINFGIVATGSPNPLRLVNPLLGGQIGWLLLFAIFGLIALWRWKWPRRPWTPYQQGVFLWGVWFLTLLLFFSFALFDHPYYVVTFSPAICALVGIGGVEMYRAYRAQIGWRSWLLPLALFATALVQWDILVPFPVWKSVLAPIIVAMSLLIGGMLALARLLPRFPRMALSGPLVAASLLVLVIAPTVWAMIPLWAGTDTLNPVAGPLLPANPLTIIEHDFVPEGVHVQPELRDYLVEHQGRARYLVAAVNAPIAAPFILDTGKSVMALGGYSGFDQILSVQQVATLVQQGDVRFFLLSKLAYLQSVFIFQPAIAQWVNAHCTLVPRNVVEPGTPGTNDTMSLGEGNDALTTQLFDCATLH